MDIQNKTIEELQSMAEVLPKGNQLRREIIREILTRQQSHEMISDEDIAVNEELEKAENPKKKSAPKKKKKLSVKQVKAHSENTSSDQLKKVAKNEKHEHRDAAKRELERRASEKEKRQEALNQKQIQHIEKRIADIEKRRAQILKKLEDANSPNAESLERELISLGKECRKLCDQMDKMDA